MRFWYVMIIILAVTLVEMNIVTMPISALENNGSYNVGLSPLKQLKLGIDSKDVNCPQGFLLIFKAENNFPACVQPKDVVKLFERGWTKVIHYYMKSDIGPEIELFDHPYEGIDKDNGTVIINNQTFYQTTLSYNVDKLGKGLSAQFQNVTFVFPEGTMVTPGGGFIALNMKFQDGSQEIFGGKTLTSNGTAIAISGIEIPSRTGPTNARDSVVILGYHVMPQAGVVIYGNQIKLLVSVDSQTT